MTTPTPTLVLWAKWGTILLGFLSLLFATGVAVVITSVRWASAPIIREESAARRSADSLIVSRLEALDWKIDAVAEALRFKEGTAGRNLRLQNVPYIEPEQVELPPSTKGPGR